jgi:two-component system, OmpR family, response regulator VicR
MKKTILVGEDDAAISDIINSILQSENYSVLLARNESEIHTHLTSASPDLIFLDIWLAGADGSKIAKSIKATKPTPVIMMSADTKTETIAREIGADGFLMKPFSLEQLLSIAQKYTTDK